MIGAEERRRLMEQAGCDEVSPLAAVLKCAAGVLILIIIAAGPWAFLSASGPTPSTESQPGPRTSAAVSESKRVFEERRRDHESARQGGASQASNAARAWFAVE